MEDAADPELRALAPSRVPGLGSVLGGGWMPKWAISRLKIPLGQGPSAVVWCAIKWISAAWPFS
jgi:hypothetical protein